MPYSIDTLTADCYEGTSCLINKLNIHDASRLAEVEASITFAKNSELEQHPFSGNFDFEHYKRSIVSCLKIFTNGRGRYEL